MKILLIGFGFVGKATFLLYNPDTEFYVYDINPDFCIPQNFYPTDLSIFDLAFICLPTPMNIDGTCDTSIIRETIKKFPHPFTIIRSTVPIGFCEENNLFFMPEFLTEKDWKNDFINNPVWYLGCPSSVSPVKRTEMHIKFEKLIKLAHFHYKIKSTDIEFCSSTEAEFLKYAKNVFLSTKVSFFNELFSLIKKYNIDYTNIVKMLKQDPRMGESHLAIPGPDNKFGYGGTCFPKDTVSLYYQNSQSPLLEANLYRNENIDRPTRDWLSDVNRTVISTSKKIALVTGGAGFLGSHLCKALLEKNCKVICVDNLITGFVDNIEGLFPNPDFKFLNMDVTKKLFFPKIDEIYHLAGIASPPKYKKYPLETLQVSIQGTINMLELAVKHSAKFLFTSTSEVYGDPLEHPQKETYWGHVNPVGERSCYDEGKRVAETLIYEYQRKYNLNTGLGFNTKIVRIFNTYGPNMDINDGRVVTSIIKSIKNNEPITIYGNGEQTRSFSYVSDTIRGILTVMNSQQHGPINIGSPIEISINELVKICKDIFPGAEKTEIKYLPSSQDDPCQRNPDITLIKSLGWEPETDLISGLNSTFLSLREKIV